MPRPDASAPALAGLRVLVVEDDADCRALLRAMLERHGAVVSAVGAVDEALLEIEDFLPDAVVSDLAMPDRDGFALIDEVRARGCILPVIAVSAREAALGQERALQRGFHGFLGKPFAAAALVALVASTSRPGTGKIRGVSSSRPFAPEGPCFSN